MIVEERTHDAIKADFFAAMRSGDADAAVASLAALDRIRIDELVAAHDELVAASDAFIDARRRAKQADDDEQEVRLRITELEARLAVAELAVRGQRPDLDPRYVGRDERVEAQAIVKKTNADLATPRAELSALEETHRPIREVLAASKARELAAQRRVAALEQAWNNDPRLRAV